MSETVNAAHGDNQTRHFTDIGVIGTLGTADVKGSANTLPFAVDPSTGAAFSNNIGTPKSIMLEIPRGNISGMSSVNKFGRSTAITTGNTWEIWDGNMAYAYPTTATITHIRTAADTPAMDGLVVEVQGLNASWDLTVQNATIDAATSTATEVELGTPLIRVFRMKVLSDVVTTNDIWVGATGVAAATAKAIIKTGNNQTLMAIYTVPNGKTAYMTNYYTTVNPGGGAPTTFNVRLWASDRANSYAKQLKHIQGVSANVGAYGRMQHPFNPYYKFTQKTDIFLTGSPTGASVDVSAGFDLILIDN